MEGDGGNGRVVGGRASGLERGLHALDVREKESEEARGSWTYKTGPVMIDEAGQGIG